LVWRGTPRQHGRRTRPCLQEGKQRTGYRYPAARPASAVTKSLKVRSRGAWCLVSKNVPSAVSADSRTRQALPSVHSGNRARSASEERRGTTAPGKVARTFLSAQWSEPTRQECLVYLGGSGAAAPHRASDTASCCGETGIGDGKFAGEVSKVHASPLEFTASACETVGCTAGAETRKT